MTNGDKIRSMTDEAVDILWKRLEAMQDEAETV